MESGKELKIRLRREIKNLEIRIVTLYGISMFIGFIAFLTILPMLENTVLKMVFICFSIYIMIQIQIAGNINKYKESIDNSERGDNK